MIKELKSATTVRSIVQIIGGVDGDPAINPNSLPLRNLLINIYSNWRQAKRGTNNIISDNEGEEYLHDQGYDWRVNRISIFIENRDPRLFPYEINAYQDSFKRIANAIENVNRDENIELDKIIEDERKRLEQDPKIPDFLGLYFLYDIARELEKARSEDSDKISQALGNQMYQIKADFKPVIFKMVAEDQAS
ncbi:MAG: hypothetical protein Q9M91_04180 [Candidatus Dojkabacteria bacterium]|nr:hypothetical protein [Candidatus Dojkabacteria bacterium]MDQ7021012.1 hypothetical protein [Candidatus Dojkabacteria bacterium]